MCTVHIQVQHVCVTALANSEALWMVLMVTCFGSVKQCVCFFLFSFPSFCLRVAPHFQLVRNTLPSLVYHTQES